MIKLFILLNFSFLLFSCTMTNKEKDKRHLTYFELPALNQEEEYIRDTTLDHQWDSDTGVNGREIREVKKVLAKKDFIKYQDYFENSVGRMLTETIIANYRRDLVPEFQEGIYYFENTIPNKSNPGISGVYSFRVTYIRHNNNIIFYELGEKCYSKQNTVHFSCIEKYKDDLEFNKLKIKFKQTFNAELNENELFIEDIICGEYCGIVGSNPKEKVTINSYVVINDRQNLMKWLQSTNTEKQVYGVDGFYQLYLLGINPNKEEMRMINSVLSKRGSIKSCNGCEVGNYNISKVLSRFNFKRKSIF